MKSRIALGLPLALALVVSAAAQTQTQPTETQNTQPPATQSQQMAPAAQVTPHEPLKIETKEGFWGKINPFARKKYIRRQLEPVSGRVNELDELTASNARAINDVDSRATEGIRVASLKANEADQKAVDAGNKANMAHQTATQATEQLTKVESTINNLDQYQAVTEAEIRFRPGQLSLSKKAKEALDEMAAPLKTQRGFVLEVQGFSAGRGSASIENSRKLADAVVRYLVVEHEIPVYRIYTVGMGNAVKPAVEGEKPRRTTGGRVEISLLKNSLSAMQQQDQSMPQNDQPQQPQKQ
ncbi:MAG TPA: OmpA family protein [Terriglobales bacterium]|nr:OmpA family protein [Terriglobales bacterium]